MKQTTKNIYIIGLCLYCFGQASGILNFLREIYDFSQNANDIELYNDYISLLSEISISSNIVAIVLKLIMLFIIIYMIVLVLKNIKSKCLMPLIFISIIFLIINLLPLSSTVDIPKYLIYSKWGIIDTLWVYYKPFLASGAIFNIIAYIIILIASIKTLKQKKKGAENNG